MNDSISRAAAIKQAVKESQADGAYGYMDTKDIVDMLNDLPSIQPKRGKWIYGEDEYGIDGYHCDKCGFFVPWDYAHKFINYIADYNFCPSCGADMRGGEDE